MSRVLVFVIRLDLATVGYWSSASALELLIGEVVKSADEPVSDRTQRCHPLSAELQSRSVIAWRSRNRWQRAGPAGGERVVIDWTRR
jgi:hypothetical protein